VPRQAKGREQVVVALNERLYNSSRVVFEQRSTLLMSKFSTEFIDGVLARTSCAETSYNISKQQGHYCFEGFPSGNLLKQVINAK